MIKDGEKEYFECQCHGDEHILTFSFWVVSDDPDCYVHIFLNHRRWYKRIWPAIRYIFGYKCKFGHFDEMILKHKDVSRLRELCQEFEKYCEANHHSCKGCIT